MKYSVIFSVLWVVLSALAVTGCEQDQKPLKTEPAPVRKFAQTTTIEGNVSNNGGIINTGKVDVSDENGHVIAQAPVANSHFQVEIPANTVLPLLLTYSSERDKEKLVTAVIYDTVTKYYINPSTTAITKAAKAMGGYTRANMVRAAESTVHTPDGNKTSAGWRGDPTSQYGGWH
jgi:hypothetical protein